MDSAFATPFFLLVTRSRSAGANCVPPPQDSEQDRDRVEVVERGERAKDGEEVRERLGPIVRLEEGLGEYERVGVAKVKTITQASFDTGA